VSTFGGKSIWAKPNNFPIELMGEKIGKEYQKK